VNVKHLRKIDHVGTEVIVSQEGIPIQAEKLTVKHGQPDTTTLTIKEEHE